jgi:FecR-like protein
MDTGNNRTENRPSTNRDDYLWDGSGEPDPEIQRLEALLGKFRHDSPAPVFPEIVRDRRWTFFPWRMRLFPALATTAAAVAAIVAVTFLVYGRRSTPTSVAGWEVSSVEGTPRIGRKTISAKEGTSRLGIGQMLETDGQSRASLQADDTGKIEVDPSTRLRLLSMGSGLKRMALDRGTIHTYIWAPPGQFVVDTPSAVTVDLGCAYTLQVDDSGAGMVRTSLGWVGFKLNGHESFIPAGAACATRPKVGPGTPYFEDASAEFRSALGRFDFEDTTPQQRAHDVAIVLGEARRGDALTLWHLLARVDEGQRVVVYDRLSRLVPPPATVTKEGILRLDLSMLDLWWNELGFDDISVWRHWERSWSGTATPVREK